jgi:hypothetical protein
MDEARHRGLGAETRDALRRMGASLAAAAKPGGGGGVDGGGGSDAHLTGQAIRPLFLNADGSSGAAAASEPPATARPDQAEDANISRPEVDAAKSEAANQGTGAKSSEKARLDAAALRPEGALPSQDGETESSAMEDESATSASGSGATVALADLDGFSDLEISQGWHPGADADSVASGGTSAAASRDNRTGDETSSAAGSGGTVGVADMDSCSDFDSSSLQKNDDDATSVGTGGTIAASADFGTDFENDDAAALPDDAERVAMGVPHRFLSEHPEEALGTLVWAKYDCAPALFDTRGVLDGYESDDEMEATHPALPDSVTVVDQLTKEYFSDDGYPVRDFAVCGPDDGKS